MHKKHKTILATESAGGIIARIRDGDVEILYLADTRYQDCIFPKGHVEQGETIEEAALREVREEAGVTEARILQKLGLVQRLVQHKNELKTIHYFLFICGRDEPREKPDSSFTKVVWLPLTNPPKMHLLEQEKLLQENIELIRDAIKKTA